MLTRLAMMALAGAMGTAVVSAPASAHEHEGGDGGGYVRGEHGDGAQRERGYVRDGGWGDQGYRGVGYGQRYRDDGEGSHRFDHERRDDFERMMRVRREAAFRHARWLHQQRGWGW